MSLKVNDYEGGYIVGNYIRLYGDPIPGNDGLPGKDVVSLSDALSSEQIADFRERFKLIPRQMFDAMMVQVIHGYSTSVNYDQMQEGIQSIMSDFEKKMMYALMLDLFNEVNAQELIKRNISDPWEWERQKIVALYQTQAHGELAASNPALFLKENEGIDYVKIVEREKLESRAVKIAEKIDDQAYRISFMSSISLLLDQEEWDAVSLMLYTYEQLPTQAWGAIKQVFTPIQGV